MGVANQKGGVGKTTTSVSIATEFALRGYRTLLVDGDPQSNATNNFLDLGKVKLERSLYDVIVEMSGVQSIPVREAAVKTIVPKLDLLPSTVRLAMFDVMPSDLINILREKLLEVQREYDFVVIDTPPSLSQLMTASLVAATHVIIPVSAAPMSHDGIDDFMNTFKRVQARSNKELALLGIVTTLFDVRLGVNGEVHELTKSRFGDLVFETIIHRTVKLEECPAFKKPVQLYAPNTRGATNYASLADEMLRRLNMEPHKGEADRGGVETE